MYPHPELNSFLQGFDARVPKKVLDRMVDKAKLDKNAHYGPRSTIPRLASTQPQCFAPNVDLTRAKCAFGSFAISKLKKELHSHDPLIVRQAVTTLGDLLVNPEKLIEAVKLNIVDRLSDLLISEDPYLRERVALVFTTIANQSAGRESILKNLGVVANLSKGLNDCLAAVRLKVALVLESLARDYCAADMLCNCGFVESVAAKLDGERNDILVVRLEILRFLLYRDVKVRAIEAGVFEKLTTLLDRKNERVILSVLSCLSVLCEDVRGKRRAIEVDLLSCLKIFVEDEALTNVAEAPKARAILLRNIEIIEAINVGCSEVQQHHKQTLLDVILWKP
ncbi:radial spoke head 14 homolog isoform X2 [Nasonia vitripennis]|uniref:Armadillo repeat-containing domain-containing protein n=1 Tax=Nasonia vitripennis TaxID=7425 RepID=A0A7M7H3Z5_NASVI|nr:radial spoke head 14 homolog isoform X2 [Nasonia vitripennis]